MAKLVLISIVIANVWVPLWAARTPSPVLGIKRVLFYMCLCDVAYLLLVLFAFPRRL